VRRSRSPCHYIYNLNAQAQDCVWEFLLKPGRLHQLVCASRRYAPANFGGKFNETTAQFNTADAVLIYTDAADLTGSYGIEAGSTVQRKKINLKLMNDSGKECKIMANLRPSIGNGMLCTV
jgi:hypothetical protein